jgi:mannose-6-phosphate isomerase
VLMGGLAGKCLGAIVLTSDPNHKPEMAIALTPFLAFLNFLPCQTILLHLLTVPELSRLVPDDLIAALASSLSLPTTLPPDVSAFQPTKAAPSESQKAALKGIFEALMTATEADFQSAIKDLIARYTAKGREGAAEIKDNEKDLVDLTIMLNEQYPGDIGVLCVFLLNVVELKEGEAAFLGANMPHAYIKGGEWFQLLLRKG